MQQELICLGASDFKLLDRQAADEFLKLPERNVFFRALSSWVGFKTAYVELTYGREKQELPNGRLNHW